MIELIRIVVLSWYIRLALNTSQEKIVRIKDGWHLSLPNLILSIIGGAKNFYMPPKLRKTFQQGLIEAAVTTNVWIITDGINARIVKEAGDAFENDRYRIDRPALDIPTIAFSYWNSIQGKEFLSKNSSHYHKSQHSINAIHLDIGDEYFIRFYVINEKEEAGKY